MTRSQPQILLSVMNLDNHKEISTKVIEDAQQFNQDQEMTLWTDKGYTVEKLTKEITGTKQYITIYLKEREVLVLPNAPKKEGSLVASDGQLVWPKGLGQEDLVRVYQRTITFTYEDGRAAGESIVQKLVLTRTAMVNLVTGEITYLPWKSSTGTQTFPSLIIPSLPGYQTKQTTLPAQGIDNLKGQSITETIVYKRSHQVIEIQVIDQATGTVLEKDEIKGKTGDAIRYPVKEVIQRYLATGYELVHNELETMPFIKVNGPKRFTIILKEKVVTFDQPSTYPIVGQSVYPELTESVTWPQGIGEDSLHRVLQRTIYFRYEDGKEVAAPVHQEAHFYRVGQVNLVTGQVHYGPWEGDVSSFPAVEAPKYPGFLAKPIHIPSWQHLSPLKDNREEVIVYAKTIQKVIITFEIDQEDTVLETIQLIGKAGEAIHYHPKDKIQEYLSAGYELVSSDFPSEGMFGSTYGEVVTYAITLRPRLCLVKADSPKAAGDLVDASTPNGPFWPKGLSQNELSRCVKRRIHFLYESGEKAFPEHEDSHWFHRCATVNLVTGQVSYQPWLEDHHVFEAVQVPRLDGYCAERPFVPSYDATPESANQELTIYYHAEDFLTYLRIYNDDNGLLKEKKSYSRDKEIITQEFKQMLTALYEAGYELSPKFKKMKFQKDAKKSELSLKVQSVKAVVTSEAPKAAFSAVEGYPRLSWPRGLEGDDLSKTVTRLISYHYQNEELPFKEEKQTVRLHRTAEVSLATGKISYGDWQGKGTGFSEVVVPERDGYEADRKSIPAKHLSQVQDDEVVRVVYRIKVGTISIVYQDAKGTLGQEVLKGTFGETLVYQPLIFAGYERLSSDCPQPLVFTGQDQRYTIRLQPKLMLVTYKSPLKSQTMMDMDGRLKVIPEGLESKDLTYVNQRVIQFVSDSGTPLFDEIVQESRVSRTAQLNLATQEITYDSWKEEHPFPEVVIPEVEGYERDQEVVPVLSVTPEGNQLVIRETARYRKKPYRFYIRVLEEETSTRLEDIELIIKLGETPRYTLDQLVERYQIEGYELVETKVVKEESYARFVDLVLQAQLVEVTGEMVRNDYSNETAERASLFRQLPGLRPYQFERYITRTIRFVNESREEVAAPFVSQVLFERSAQVNLVTRDVIFGEWISNYPIFDATIPPLVAGYEAQQEFIASVEVTSPYTSDCVEEILYCPTDASTVIDSVEPEPLKEEVDKKEVAVVPSDKEIVSSTRTETAPAQSLSTTIDKVSFWQRLKRLIFAEKR